MESQAPSRRTSGSLRGPTTGQTVAGPGTSLHTQGKTNGDVRVGLGPDRTSRGRGRFQHPRRAGRGGAGRGGGAHGRRRRLPSRETQGTEGCPAADRINSKARLRQDGDYSVRVEGLRPSGKAGEVPEPGPKGGTRSGGAHGDRNPRVRGLRGREGQKGGHRGVRGGGR